ncbi:MAG: hypothetical protein KDK12_09785 [Rhodobacteraceae bacterium]|nr:hypothetical protein [Paracoccaceae bacterium]
MFDWDTHYDDVVGPAAGHEQAEPAEDTRALLRRWALELRSLVGHWAMAGIVALALGAIGSGAMMLPREAPARWLSAATQWSAGVLGLDDSARPAELLAYDQAQYDRFRRGIARFSDTDLLDYIRVTQHDLNGANPMAAYTHDALYLAQREVERRGLFRPHASLRDAFLRS